MSASLDEQAKRIVGDMADSEYNALTRLFVTGLESHYWYLRPRDLDSTDIPYVVNWRKQGLIQPLNGNKRHYHLTWLGRAVGRLIFGLDERGRVKQ